MSRAWGEDAALLAAAGADVDALAALEGELRAGLDLLPGRGEWWDAHAHLGADADGHRMAADDLVRDLDRWGIARAVCFAANDPGPAGDFTEANALVCEAARRHHERLVPFCRVDPRGPWGEALERAAADGARGLKLHPVSQRFAPDSPGCVAVVAVAAERGWPVLIHAGYGARPLGGPLAALAAAVPDARLILAHGARGDARAVAAALAGRPAVMFDTSLAALADVAALPAERLCLGADRPYGEHGTALHLVAAAARVAGWSREQTAGVLGGNLAGWLEP